MFQVGNVKMRCIRTLVNTEGLVLAFLYLMRRVWSGWLMWVLVIDVLSGFRGRSRSRTPKNSNTRCDEEKENPPRTNQPISASDSANRSRSIPPKKETRDRIAQGNSSFTGSTSTGTQLGFLDVKSLFFSNLFTPHGV